MRADGSLAERADKHPFCMSRVYYDATEKPEEVGGMQHLHGNATPGGGAIHDGGKGLETVRVWLWKEAS